MKNDTLCAQASTTAAVDVEATRSAAYYAGAARRNGSVNPQIFRAAAVQGGLSSSQRPASRGEQHPGGRRGGGSGGGSHRCSGGGGSSHRSGHGGGGHAGASRAAQPPGAQGDHKSAIEQLKAEQQARRAAAEARKAAERQEREARRLAQQQQWQSQSQQLTQPSDDARANERPLAASEAPGYRKLALSIAHAYSCGGEQDRIVELEAPLDVTSDKEERRLDASDGGAYTRVEFIEFYGGVSEWEAAANLERT